MQFAHSRAPQAPPVPYAVAGHVVASFRGMLPAGDLLSRPLEERVVYSMDEAETEMYVPTTGMLGIMYVYHHGDKSDNCYFFNAESQVHAAAQLPMSAVNTGQP